MTLLFQKPCFCIAFYLRADEMNSRISNHSQNRKANYKPLKTTPHLSWGGGGKRSFPNLRINYLLYSIPSSKSAEI